MDIDVRCSVCNHIEFLPLKCKKCFKITCTAHSIGHPCIPVIKEPIPIRTEIRTEYCHQKECTKRTLVLIQCEKCRVDYCVKHTYIHECQPAYLRSRLL
jgi:predicted nucleic acid binding AN1-type Zn finger protein